MVFEVEIYPTMPRKKSKSVPEGNDIIPQDISGLLGTITLEEKRRILPEALDKSSDNFFGLEP